MRTLTLFFISLALHAGAAQIPENFGPDRLVAWCIVPFDAASRTPEQRASMLRSLGMTRCAYDWRQEHVPTFEAEILAYRKHGIDFTAFWGTHPDALALFEKYSLSPQIWQTCPSPDAPSQAARISAAADALAPVAAQADTIGSPLALYNHGGWGGEPENLIAVCLELRRRGYPRTGIVYNLHHAHRRTPTFAADLALLKPYLLCLNLNGTNTTPDPKILPLGKGAHDAEIIATILNSSYSGPVGIIDHLPDTDSRTALQQNLSGLSDLLRQSN